MDFWVQVGRYCVANLNHIYFASATVESSWDMGWNWICSARNFVQSPGWCASCFLSTRPERKSCWFKYHTMMMLVVYSTSYHHLQVSMLLVWWMEATLRGEGMYSFLVGHFLETSSIWCPFLTLHAGLPAGPYNTKLVMAVRAQQALLRQRGVCVTSSQECFLVPLDSVVDEGVEEMDQATLQ